MEVNTPELSSVAKVLISRMETHPEDFELGGRFFEYANSLYGLHGLPFGSEGNHKLWALSDADREALKIAWRKWVYTRMENSVLTKVFMEEADLEPKYTVSAGSSITSTSLPQWTDPRLMSSGLIAQQAATNFPVQNATQNAYPQTAQNSTGLNSGGGFFQNIFGGSK